MQTGTGNISSALQRASAHKNHDAEGVNQAIMARMQEHGEAAVMEMLEIAGRSKFLAGQNTHQWTATFDWLFKPTNFIKTLERNYDDKTKQYDNGRTTAGGDQRKCFTGEYSEAF